MTTVVFELKKTYRFKRDVGKHSVAYDLYFFRIWILHDDFISTIQKSHDQGFSEGRKVGQKEVTKFWKN